MTEQQLEETAEVGVKPATGDVAESLTGFDELAIARAFGTGVGNLDGTMTLRALAFVLHRRVGADDKAAFRMAMQVTLKEITGLFADQDDAEDDDGEGNG